MLRLRPFGPVEGAVSDLEHPAVDPGWIREAVRAGREAFEREMARDRADREAEFRRYWREREAARD
jgi:hypothetical protein